MSGVPSRDPLSLPAILDALGTRTDEPDKPYDPVLALRRMAVLLGMDASAPSPVDARG